MFIDNNKSVTATRRAFHVHFRPGRHAPVPTRNTILLWITSFRATGLALKRKSAGRLRTAKTLENVIAVRAFTISTTFCLETWQICLDFPIEVYEELFTRKCKYIHTKWFWWKNSAKETMKLAEHCLWKFNISLCSICVDQRRTPVSREWKFPIRDREQPPWVYERSLHCLQTTVQCSVAEFSIWDPYIFKEDNVTETVNCDEYYVMLESFLKPKLNEHDDRDDIWFQKDGSQPTHLDLQ